MKLYHCFYFSGYYAAMAASELLGSHGIGSRVVKAPVSGQRGCRFAVVVAEQDGAQAKAWMDRERAAYDSHAVVKR